MTKAVFFPLVFLFLFAFGAPLRAQVSATDMAVEQAVLDQHNTILLRQKIEEANAAESRGDLPVAAKLYEAAYVLTQQIGSGIEAETARTISGLVSVHMELARRAQQKEDYIEADAQVTRVLKVALKSPDALAFKQKNDAILESMKGKMPDVATLEKLPLIAKDKQDAGTLVQDGKLLYESGKFEEAQVKLEQALKLDPDNQAAVYYLNLTKQAFYGREEQKRTTAAQDAMVQVAKAWSPKVGIGLPVPNPYVTNTSIHTSVSREKIYDKLAQIHLNISWPDGLPLSEVMRNLYDQSKIRDPDQKGVNFLFNPNQESAGAAAGNAPGGPVAVNPNTGLPPATATGGEAIDPSTINVKLTLNDVTLQEALDAIVLVADHPIRYSVGDYGVIFAVKPSGPEPPVLEMRVFKADANTFSQGLQGVTSFTFGSANNSSSGNGGSGGSGGGNSGGNNGGNNGGGGNGNNVSGAIVPIIDVTGGSRNNGNGGGGNQGGRGNTGGNGGGNNGGGLNYITSVGNMEVVSVAAQTFFKAVGVDLTTPGRSISFNDRLGLLFVKAAPGELDTIERTIQVLNQVAPEVHVKARFIEVSQDDNAALGFDWYLGNFINGRVIANGGSAPSLTVPPSAANPLGAFPGNTAASLIPGSAGDQLLTGGLRNTGPALATVTGILTDPNFRVVLHALEQRTGVETLATPEVVTTSGRQAQMRATDIQYILTGFSFQQNVGGGTTTGTGIP
ncbi:MAG TPA: hypothetical protein VE344_06395 [Methylomirabilota bacterium]|nr:hypothetical protein [Methylomirabilota bacterium]